MRAVAAGFVLLLFLASAANMLAPSVITVEERRGTIFYSSDGGPPHSIILMIGDGMGYGHVRLGTWVEAGKEGNLTMTTLDHGLSVTTYSADSPITDSAAAATALGTGVKTNNGRLSMAPDGQALNTILEIAQSLNKSSGVVSTTEVQDATPAAFMTHVVSRSNYAEITRQIVEEAGVDVLLGGGLAYFSSQQLQTMQTNGYAIVTNRSGLLSVSSGKLLGLFASSHIGYEQNRNYTSTPSLAEMTGKAIDILCGDPDGFFLMVEGGMIDKAAHVNEKVNVALDTIAFDKAVKTALDYVSANSHTMLIVVADHETGGLSLTGDTLDAEVPSYGNTEQYNRSLRIERALNVSTSWTTTGHTSTNVPLYQQGCLPTNWTGLTTIDNTDVFGAMSAHLSLDVPHEEVGPQIELRNPSNGSIVKPFTSIDLNITDPSGVDVVLYHWDIIANDTLAPPYHLAARTSQVAHWLHIYASDIYGNWASAVFLFTTDGTEPYISLFTPGNGTMQYSGVTVAVNVSDTHLTEALYHWDSQPANTTWVAPYETTLPAGDGPHLLYVYTNDSAGNMAHRLYVFYTHDGSPMITLLTWTNGSVVRSGLTIEVDVDDQKLDTVLYAWNEVANYAEWVSPFETQVPGGEEAQILYVWANNTHGMSTEVHFQFTIDDLQPQVTLQSPANLSVCIRDTEIAFEISDLHLASVLIRWDDAAANSTWSPPYVTHLPPSDGLHTLTVYAIDVAGNCMSIKALFTADTTSPAIILVGPANGTVVRSEAGIALNITDLHFSHAWFGWDGAPNMSLENPFTILLPSGKGWHRLVVAANDTAGNLRCGVFAWVVDDTAPVIVSPGNVIMHLGEPGRNVTWQAEELNPASYEILLNGSLWSSGLWNSSSETLIVLLHSLGPGVYNFTVTLEDKAGNRASDTVIVVVVENTTSTTTGIPTSETSTGNTSSTSPTGGALTVEIAIVLGALTAGFVVSGILIMRFRKSAQGPGRP